MLRNPNGGAVVYLGTSRQGLISGGYTGGHSYDYARMFYTELFKNGRATFGEAFAYSKIDLIGSCQTEGGYRYIQYHLNFQGDPAISIKAQEPGKTLQIDSPNAREFIDQGALLPIRWVRWRKRMAEWR